MGTPRWTVRSQPSATDRAATAAAKAREWTQRRDAAIRAAVADGVSLRTVAATTGLSHNAVWKIARRS